MFSILVVYLTTILLHTIIQNLTTAFTFVCFIRFTSLLALLLASSFWLLYTHFSLQFCLLPGCLVEMDNLSFCDTFTKPNSNKVWCTVQTQTFRCFQRIANNFYVCWDKRTNAHFRRVVQICYTYTKESSRSIQFT